MPKFSNSGILFEHKIAEKLKGQSFTHIKVTKASRDYGADILAFKDGLEYVIQCKHYKGTVGYGAVKDVSAAMEFYQADRGILICDTGFSKPAFEAIRKIDKPIELIGIEELREWKASKVKPTKYKPFPYQRSILFKLIRHRKQGNFSALLVMATGLGKTLVAAWDLKNQIKKKEKALFLVHRKDILVDNAEKFNTVLNDSSRKIRLGIYFGGKRFDKKDDVVFSTFQTITKYYKKIPKSFFNYIIIDEAHHSPAPTYADIFSYFNPKFILGITATPKRLTKSDNQFIHDVFGKPVVDLDLAESLLKGYLSPVKYSVFCDNIDYGKLKAANRKLSIEQLNQSYFIPTKDEDIERIIKAESKKLKNPKTIIFCPNIKYINSVKNMGIFLDAEVYHSSMTDFERSIIFRRFKIGKIRTLLVVDLFNEGIDIPDANLVVFLRTTYSPTIFFQQLGRGLRKARDKKYLRVLDFVGALSNIRKIINVFGHLLIIQDFVEKFENEKRLSNVYRGQRVKPAGILDPLDLSFYQAGKSVTHKGAIFKKKDFLSEIRFLKHYLRKSEGWTENDVFNTLKPICEKLGCFPTNAYLRSINRSDLAAAITRLGGFHYFAAKLNLTISEKPKKYWLVWDNFQKEILPICQKIKAMPTQSYLVSIGRSDLINAILKWGGLYEVGERLGYKVLTQRPGGYWQDFDNLKKELLPICKKINGMPTQKYLKKIRRGDLNNAIAISGGFYKVAERLGYKVITQKPRGYWERNLKKELLPICKKLGEMPTRGYFQKIGRMDLAAAVETQGGVYEVGKELGYEIKSQKPPGYWKDFNNFKNELFPILKKLKRMPTQLELKSSERYDLVNIIGKWGGFYKVAQRLGYKMKSNTKPPDYWKKHLEKELLLICKKFKRMPSRTELKNMDRDDLISAINHSGGVYKIAKKLKYEVITQKPAGYWNNFARIKEEIMPIYRKLKLMPTRKYLENIGRHDLIGAINKWGGIAKINKRLKRLENK